MQSLTGKAARMIDWAPTKGTMRNFLTRRLDRLELLVLMLDEVQIARHTVVLALGILSDRGKVVLGLWRGSTENAALCTSALHEPAPARTQDQGKSAVRDRRQARVAQGALRAG